MVLHRVKTGVWMCDQGGEGGNSPRINPLCKRHPASTHTLLGYTARGQKTLALLELLKVTFHQILFSWCLGTTEMYCLVWLVLFSSGFLSPLCLSSTTQRVPSEQLVPSIYTSSTDPLSDCFSSFSVGGPEVLWVYFLLYDCEGNGHIRIVKMG